MAWDNRITVTTKRCTVALNSHRNMNKVLRSTSEIFSGNKLLRSEAFINGTWVKCRKSFPVYSPSTNAVICDVSDAGPEEANSAINSAATAFDAWRNTSVKDRSALIYAFYQNVCRKKEILANIMSAESGKTISQTRVEVDFGASFLQWFAEEAKRIDGDAMAGADSQSRRFIFKEPVGVVGLITPWNFPLAMITRKLGAAMAAGCTSVIKPSEETPLTALALAAVSEESGIPPGVLNIIPSSREQTPIIGDILCESKAIKKLSFTGSTATGKLLFKKSANTMKRLSLELGGNAPFIVFNSADIQNSVESALVAKFRANGQACIAANRFFVQKEIHGIFVEKMKKAVQKLQVGDPFDETADVSSLINAEGIEKVESHIADAIEKGGRPLAGCERHPLGPNFLMPSIIDNCNESMLCMKEETFGPLIPIMTFESEQQVIKMANLVDSGLAGYVFSSDVGQIFRVGKELEVGVLGVNTGAIASEMMPFGGTKESGFGREGSKYGINEYLQLRYICLSGL